MLMLATPVATSTRDATVLLVLDRAQMFGRLDGSVTSDAWGWGSNPGQCRQEHLVGSHGKITVSGFLAAVVGGLHQEGHLA